MKAPFVVNSQSISDYIIAAVSSLEVQITVKSGIHWVSRSSTSDSSLSHWRARSGPGAAGAGVPVGGGVEMGGATEAAGLVGWLMEPSRCPIWFPPLT